MTKPTIHGIFSAVLLGLLVPWIGAGPTVAQPDSSNLTQERRSSPDRGNAPAQPGASVTQVGAGTTSGSTTGYSGPKKDAAAAPEAISVPPLPSAQLCEPYKDTPAHQSCLSVTLRQ
jgi:hypothetical protein